MPIPFLYVLYQFFKRLWLLLKKPELRGLLFFVLLILALGTFFYAKVEGWNLLDAFYFTVITLTTIGYGDFAPKTPAGKIFTVFYILMGLGTLAVFISSIAEQTIEEQRQRALGKTVSNEAKKDRQGDAKDKP